MNTMSGQSNSSSRSSMDPLELLDFSEYDGMNYQSPNVSPSTTSKQHFSRPVTTAPTPTPMPSRQHMSGPSHQYDMYKQQTPFVPGAVASTLAVNQNSNMPGYTLDAMASEMSTNNDLFDFNTAPSQGSLQNADMDLDFDSPSEAAFFFQESSINPSATQAMSPPVLSSHSNVGRMYPGMHQQAALAKAQAQQRQQQQIIQQQQQMRQGAPPQQKQRKSAQPNDPLVEQKISQLLNSMRAKSIGSDGSGDTPTASMPRLRKDEDDMDEDERLLASEEGKKLSSKERRQLRNKVSARAFRSRRKEYITQLEAEIATKVTENGDLRAQNRSLMEENKRLSDLTRMLLSSPSFSGFLDNLSSNPSAMPQQQQQQPQQVEQRQPENRQPKDVNPYAAQNAHHQQIGMAMIPEQAMDFSMLSIDTADGFNYQPQVFAVLETPEMPEIDTEVLAGKSSNLVEYTESSDEKLEIPSIERPVPVELEKPTSPEAPSAPVVDEAFDAEFVLYRDASASESVEVNTADMSTINIFGGIAPEKALARYELVDASEAGAAASRSLAKIERISAGLESLTARLERLTVEL